MPLLQSLTQQLGAIWGKLSAGHRIILFLLCLVCGGALVAVVYWAGATEYEILYTGLDAKSCSDVVGTLKDVGIPVRVADGGSAVMVPCSKVHEARMAAAEKGLSAVSPTGGFEAFKSPKIGMTPFAERITYLSALQNELAQTIMSLDAVAHARVHLVLPERSVFKQDGKRPTASVLVATRGNRSLTRMQASAVANLVASAVEGMSAEDVTVTDGNGNVLAGGGEGGAEMAADDQFAYRQNMESYLSDKAETMLGMVLGPSRCEVRVTAELDFQDTRETRRQYDPDSKVLISERIETSETGSGALPVEVGGASGSSSNLPGQGSQPQAAAPQNKSKSETIDTQYMVTESVTEKVNRGAKILRLTVAALVDLTPPETGDDTEQEGASALPVPTKAEVENIVKEAVGFDATRGDSLQIVEAKFKPLLAGVAAEEADWAPTWAIAAGQYFAIGVLGLVLFFIARRVLKSIPADAPRRVIVPEIMGPGGLGQQSNQLSAEEVMRRQIDKLVEGDPRTAGRLLEGWVEGEE